MALTPPRVLVSYSYISVCDHAPLVNEVPSKGTVSARHHPDALESLCFLIDFVRLEWYCLWQTNLLYSTTLTQVSQATDKPVVSVTLGSALIYEVFSSLTLNPGSCCRLRLMILCDVCTWALCGGSGITDKASGELSTGTV